MDKNMTLEKRIAAELYCYQGRMRVFVDDLQGHTVEVGADEEFETASTIKAFLLAALYLQVRRGRASLTDELAYEQLTKQLNKLVSVFKITDLTDTSAIERELVLFKVNAAPDRRNEIIEIANVFRAKIVDVGRSSLTIEATGDESKLKGMEDLFRAYGIKEITRTGKIAMSRASKES